jgi:hypothetical protein
MGGYMVSALACLTALPALGTQPRGDIFPSTWLFRDQVGRVPGAAVFRYRRPAVGFPERKHFRSFPGLYQGFTRKLRGL